MFNRSAAQSTSHSFQPSLNSPQKTKKRRRQPSVSDQLSPLTNTGDGRIKPRRIDPDRLAIRLGPELVSEMDACIVPGAKMPTFQVRQTLVTKYNVDRRHIYDYFHSRGLRVAKEDKHLNLSHRMSRKPGAARKPAASRKPAPLQVVSSGDSKPLESSDVIDSSSSQPNAAVAKSTNSSNRKTAPPRPAPALQISIGPLLPSIQPIDLSSDTSSISEDDNTFDFTDSPAESSSFGEDLELVSLGYPVSEKLSESFGLEVSPFSTALDPLEDPLFEINQLQPDTPESMPSSVHDSFLPLDGLSRLSQSERIDFYNIINDGIGPALGIEESAGTYKAHMERLHFNRWRPVVPRHHSIDLPISRPQAVSVVPRPPTITEKENIDPQASASRTNSRPSNNHHYLQSAGPSSSPHIRNSHHLSVTSRREHPPTPFPPAPTNPLMPPTSSATPPSAPLPRGRPTPLIWTSPIKNSQSTSFRTQQWQTQLSQAFAARVSPFAIPYSYPAAGDRSRIVHKPKTIAPRVGMCSGEPK